MQNSGIRHNWSLKEISRLFAVPFMSLIYQAQTEHLKYFPANTIQTCSLLSLKTGACPEDCAYCAQSKHYKSKIKSHALLEVDAVIAAAKAAKTNGLTRFCMAASGRAPIEREFKRILDVVREVKKLGLETCLTLGMLTNNQTIELKDAGLDCYNHNLDTSREYYKKIISTRTYQDRLNTLENLCQVGIKICCGGIIGMGEGKQDRVAFLQQLANFSQHPHSVPINYFIPMEGTPLANLKPLDPFEFVRTIAVARILMPQSVIRLSAGRERMSDELQALCFCAGANSIFCGEKLLTAKNPSLNKDYLLLKRLGIKTKII